MRVVEKGLQEASKGAANWARGCKQGERTDGYHRVRATSEEEGVLSGIFTEVDSRIDPDVKQTLWLNEE